MGVFAKSTGRRGLGRRALGAVAGVAAVFLAFGASAALAEPAELYDDNPPAKIGSIEIPEHFPRLCSRFALLLESRHYLQKHIDEQVSAQAWTNYLMMLDYDRSYFLQSDVESFEPWRLRLHKDLKSGNLEFPLEVFKVFRQRLAERYEFVKKFLEEEQDYSVDEDYVWNRKDQPWPATPVEQDELWRKRMKNELLGRIVSRDFAESNKIEKVSSALSVTNAVADVAAEVCAATNAPVMVGDASAATVTNAVADAATQDAPSTNVADAALAPAPLDMSPEAVVGRRYKQFVGIINDADADYVIERFLCSFTQAYDPHTTYMPPTKVDDFNIDMSLSLCGIGATLQSEDGMAKIVGILPGGPADRDKRDIRLRENDKIFAVGQDTAPAEDIVHLPLDKIVKRIRGKKGTRVVLHVICGDDPSGGKTKVVDLIRDDIKLEESAATGRVVRVSMPLGKSPAGQERQSASATGMVERAFGYLRLPMFYGSMSPPGSPDFRSCTLDSQNIMSRFNPEVEGMILDLRGNGGGSLREAVTLFGAFVRMGPVVIVREVAGAQPLADQDPAITFRKPLVVLIDRASASASEIVAAALQDYGRAVIVGDTRSHGKGSVQNVMPLLSADDRYGSFKVTIASFYRVNGSSTQIKGVESDIVLPSMLEYMDLGEEKLPNALPWTSIPPVRHPVVYPLGGLIPSLAEKSAARLAGNRDWAAHMEKVMHVSNVTQRVSVPLSYSRRFALLKADNAVGVDSESDEDDEFDGMGAEKAEKADAADDGIGDDIVLREAFNILADLVDAQGNAGITVSQDGDSSDWIFKFFR